MSEIQSYVMQTFGDVIGAAFLADMDPDMIPSVNPMDPTPYIDARIGMCEGILFESTVGPTPTLREFRSIIVEVLEFDVVLKVTIAACDKRIIEHYYPSMVVYLQRFIWGGGGISERILKEFPEIKSQFPDPLERRDFRNLAAVFRAVINSEKSEWHRTLGKELVLGKLSCPCHACGHNGIRK
ncbi:hypothetical protein OXX69_003196 [Metschnikowia pulcherrima]